MHRRNFLALGSAGLAVAGTSKTRNVLPAALCSCSPLPEAVPAGLQAFDHLHSGLKITGMKVFGVSLNPQSDRPYVFVKLETNQGLVGWGEGTLEGKAGAVMACMNDFRDFLIGADPMQVEHIWQSMYVHSFYRAGPVIGSAISGIDQALWDIRGKALGCRYTSCLADLLMLAAFAATITPMECARRTIDAASRDRIARRASPASSPASRLTTNGSRRAA